MSVSAITSSSLSQSAQSYFQQRQTDLKQLGQALHSGDLAGAQQAYNAIVALRQNGPSPTSAAFLRSGRQQDFAAIGQALQSGDLSGAQQAFSQLQNTFSFNHRLRTLDPGGPAPVVTTTATSAASSSGAAASSNSLAPASTPHSPAELVLNLGNIGGGAGSEQVTINLSHGNSGGERVSISLGNQQTPNAEQINVNLSQGSNERIVLNLFNATAASPSNGDALSVSA
jgi:hypothetical protein